MKGRELPGKSLKWILLVLVTVIILFPLFNIVIISINSEIELTKNPFNIPKFPKFDNYIVGWEKSHYGQCFINTVIVLIGTIILNVLITSLSAYAVLRFKYAEVRAMYFLFIIGMFVPIQVIILPLFSTLKTLHILNTLFSLVLIYSAINIPISFMIFSGFFKSVPKELEESAFIDGAGYLRTFLFIVMPISKVTIATTSILVSLYVWRDFFVPLVTILSPSKKTLAVGLLAFMNQYSTDWNPLSAAMILQIVPFLVIFLFFQKYFIRGISAGALKG